MSSEFGSYFESVPHGRTTEMFKQWRESVKNETDIAKKYGITQHVPKIKEGTYCVGTSSEALHMDYAKPTEWPRGGTAVIKDNEGNTFTVVPPEEATHMVYDENGKSHWGKEDSPKITVKTESPVIMNIEIQTNDGVWTSLSDSMKEASKAAKEWTLASTEIFPTSVTPVYTLTGDVTWFDQSDEALEAALVTMNNVSPADWFEADCIHSDCDGYYDIDGDSCYCNATPYPPCSVCEGGELTCISCGDYPPEDTDETASDVDGMWDALQDICRG